MPNFTSAYWRERAEEARTKAEVMVDPSAKAAMQLAADNYETMASRTELLERLSQAPDRS